MVKKSLLTAVLLFLGYETFVSFFAPRWWTAAQGQFQDNLIKAQQFVYDKNLDSAVVIIGSSMSDVLSDDSLPGAYNLSLAGHGIFDGLEVLGKSGKTPKFVFIETNFLFTAKDKDFLDNLFSPLHYYPRYYIKSLQEDKQPVAILGDQLYWRITATLLQKIKPTADAKPAASGLEKHSGILEEVLPMQIKNYSKAIDEKTLKEMFSQLSKDIRELEEKGIKIVFFEMPVNRRLLSLPGATRMRKAFFDHFSPSKYTYVISPDSAEYITNDGIHLGDLEALKFTSYVKAQTKELLGKQ